MTVVVYKFDDITMRRARGNLFLQEDFDESRGTSHI